LKSGVVPASKNYEHLTISFGSKDSCWHKEKICEGANNS